jgi:cellulose synthase/poly-beta-1,6-N-acetylglucosamine synthase-like glycosyltransferase
VITVAIPTLARPAYALDALRSVAAQVCDTPFEVLFLDNGCDSRLAESVRLVARSATMPINYVPVSAVGLHNARHEAVRRAHGDILAYLDDDVVVEPGWLAGLASGFSDPAVHLVGGRCLPLYEADPPPWLEAFLMRNDDGTWSCGWLTLVDLGPDAKDIDPMSVWGANFAIRKETLIRVGGFHPDGLPWHLRRFRGDGETAVSRAVQKLGLRAAYSPDATVHHRVPQERLTEQYFERRAFLQGISASFSASRSSYGDVEARPRPGLGRRLFGRIKSLAAERTERERVPREWQAHRSRAAEAHAAGYTYHQEQLQRSPAVRAWVTRPDYWAGSVPDPDDRPPATEGDAHRMRLKATS